MALITTAAREELVALVVAMFRAAPGANYLSQLVTAYESGATTAQIAAALSTKAQFNLVYPSLLTAEEFAAELVETLLDAGTPQVAIDFATNWVVTNLQAGKSRAQVITEAVQAIRATTNPNYATAQAQLENKVEVATYFSVTKLQSSTSLAALQDVVNGVTADDATVVSGKEEVDDFEANNSGQIFTLTTGTDTGTAFTGSSGNDIFNANVGVVIDPGTGTAFNVDTLQGVDNLVGGSGTDTLNVTGKGGTIILGSLSGIEVINAQSLGALTINTATVTDATNLNITKAVGAVDVTASANTDISVAMTAGGAAVDVAGGNDVNVSLTDVAGAADIVSIGIGADADATGAVSVSMTGKAYTATTANTTLSAVNAEGGTSISVTQKAAADIAAAATDTTNATITQGAIAITGNATTTTVTVTQDAPVTAANATFKTGGVTETASVKFGKLDANDTLQVAGLTLTATTAMTAAEVAAAFAGIANNAQFESPVIDIVAGDVNGSSKGTFSGDATGWTSGAVSTDTVVFTSTTANTSVADLAPVLTGTGTAPVVTTTEGKAHDAGAAGGKMGVVAGAVTVNDVGGTINTITIDGFGGASSTTATAALATLNLTNAAGGTTMTVADTAAALTLNAEKLGTGGAVPVDATLTLTAAPTTLNIKSTGANYVALTADATEALTVSGTGVFDADANDLLALKTVVVTETAGVKLNAGVASSVTSVDTTGTTGATTITIEGARATFAGGAGVDSVTLATDTALTKSISLGAGDDTLSFGVLAVTGSTAAVAGGEGTDTLSMSVAAAAALDGAAQSFYTGFERLTLNDAGAGGETIDLANLGFTSYVTTSGSGGTLTLDKMASGGTVVLTVAPTTGTTVNVTDAATGTADVLNAVLSSASSLDGKVLTAANVETVNLTSTDTNTFNGANANLLTLTANKATSVTVAGNAALTLMMTSSVDVTSINASAMTKGLTVTSLNVTSATTITGGSGNDVLTAATGTTADVLVGGAGNDVLVANAGLTTLTGGEGADVFVAATPSLNVNSYATITDLASGDFLQLAAAVTTFESAKVTLGDTAVFQDYANAAINTLTANESGWFQFGGNTYVVADLGAEGTAFVESQDLIVRITGLVDLTTASYNSTYDTIGF